MFEIPWKKANIFFVELGKNSKCSFCLDLVSKFQIELRVNNLLNGEKQQNKEMTMRYDAVGWSIIWSYVNYCKKN